MRPVCRRCRDALLTALARQLPCLEPAGVSARLRLVTWLPPYLDEATVAGAAARAGVGIERVTPYRISPPAPVVSSSATRPSTSRPSHAPDLLRIDNAARAITLVQDGGEAPGGARTRVRHGPAAGSLRRSGGPAERGDTRSSGPHIYPANGRE